MPKPVVADEPCEAAIGVMRHIDRSLVLLVSDYNAEIVPSLLFRVDASLN